VTVACKAMLVHRKWNRDGGWSIDITASISISFWW